MLNNTGGATQAFASLHAAMSSEEGQRMEATDLLPKIEIMNFVDQWTKNFGIPGELLTNDGADTTSPSKPEPEPEPPPPPHP